MRAPGIRGYARRATHIGYDSPLNSHRFVQMLFARITSNVAVNALHYALLIAVVQQTGSTIHSSLIIFTFTAPSVLVGMVAGVAVDRLSRRAILIAVHILRAVACVALFRFGDSVWAMYAISLLFSMVNPFAGPAEYAVLPGLVGSSRLTSGHAWLNLTSLVGQAAGVGVVAPVLLKTTGAESVYLLAAILYGAAALLVVQMGRLTRAPVTPGRPASGLRDVKAEFMRVWQFIRADRQAYLATVETTVVTTSLLVAVSLVPTYVDEVLGVSADNAVFVFAPAVIGMAAGLRFVTPLSNFVGKPVVITGGFLMLIGTAFAMGFIEPLSSLLTMWDLGMSEIDSLPTPPAVVVTAMIVAVPLGFANTAVTVAARAVLQERSPPELQGRVFAMQGVLSSLGALAPLLLGGALAELLGVRAVIIGIGVVAAAVGLYTRLGERVNARRSREEGGAGFEEAYR